MSKQVKKSLEKYKLSLSLCFMNNHPKIEYLRLTEIRACGMINTQRIEKRKNTLSSIHNDDREAVRTFVFFF